jgi:hypothetical protein
MFKASKHSKLKHMIILIILGIILVYELYFKTDQNPLSKFSNLFKIIGVLLIAGVYSLQHLSKLMLVQ